MNLSRTVLASRQSSESRFTSLSLRGPAQSPTRGNDVLFRLHSVVPDLLGGHWCQLRQLFLPYCGIYPNSEIKLVAWESTDLHFKEPGITVVANTRWLGSVAGRWLGGPMAAVGPAVDKADKVRSTQ